MARRHRGHMRDMPMPPPLYALPEQERISEARKKAEDERRSRHNVHKWYPPMPGQRYQYCKQKGCSARKEVDDG